MLDRWGLRVTHVTVDLETRVQRFPNRAEFSYRAKQRSLEFIHVVTERV